MSLTQICFPIGGERVTCRGSKLLGRTKGSNNFRLARDEVVHIETRGKFIVPSDVKQIIFSQFFFSISELGVFTSGNIEGLGETKLSVSLNYRAGLFKARLT